MANKKIKRVSLTYQEDTGNKNRRVKYGNKEDFDTLLVQFTHGNKVRHFEIKSEDLPNKDSIHLKFDPYVETINWSPKEINSKAVER